MNNPYTYIIVCPNWKLYYGYRYANKVSPEEDLWKHYFSSSDPVKELRKQYDDALFVATVDKIFETKDEARAYEEEFLTENGCVKSDFWLNMCNAGKEFHTPEHMTEDHKENISKSLTGRKLSESHKENMSKSMKGKPKPPRTEKHKENLRKPKPPRTEKHRENISKSMTGRKLSESHIENMRKPKSEKSIKKRTETRRKKRLEDPNYGIPKPAPKKTNSVYDKV